MLVLIFGSIAAVVYFLLEVFTELGWGLTFVAAGVTALATAVLSVEYLDAKDGSRIVLPRWLRRVIVPVLWFGLLATLATAIWQYANAPH